MAIDTLCTQLSDLQLDPFYQDCSRNGISTTRLQNALKTPYRPTNTTYNLIGSIASSHFMIKQGDTPSFEELASVVSNYIQNYPPYQPIELSIIQNSDKKKTLLIPQLTIVTLLDKTDLLSAMVQQGHDPNAADIHGYTACHIAAMTNIKALVILHEYGGKLDQETIQHLSVYDILKARGLCEPATGNITVFKDLVTDMTIVSELIGRTYLRHNVYSTDALLSLWLFLNTPEESSTLTTWPQIKADPAPYDPPIYIKRIPKGKLLAGEFELRAKRNIAEGETIVEYTGDVYANEELSGNLKYGIVLTPRLLLNAEGKGTFAELSNHSAPNCIFVRSENENGFPSLLMVALCEIEENKRLFVDYGRQYFYDSSPQIMPLELHPKAVAQFIVHTQKLTEFDISLYPPLYTDAMCLYLYSFPRLLFGCITKKILPSQNVEMFFKHCQASEIADEISIDPELCAQYHQKLLQELAQSHHQYAETPADAATL